MQSVSSAASTALSSGTVRVRLLAESASLSVDGDGILSLSYHAACADGDIGIGNVLAASISARLKGVFPLLGTVIRAQYGVEVGGSVEWLNLGRFTVTSCTRTDHETQIAAYDAAYTLSGQYVPTVQSGATVSAVLADVADQCGLDVEQTTLNYGLQITVTGTLTGHSLREMLGYLAGLCGRNCVISRDGFVRFVWFEASGATVTADDYYSGTLSNGGVSTFAGLRCTVPSAQEGQEDTVLTVGDADRAVECSNPFMTQVRLSAIWSAVGGYEYLTGEVSFYRGVLTEPGDVVSLTNLAGVTIQLPVMQVELTVDGGGRCTVRSYGRGDVSRSCDSVGPRELRLRRVQSTADSALLSANGKNKNFYQASAPTSSAGLTEGDLWFDTANGNRVSEWTGSAWALRQFGDAAIANINAGKITAGQILAQFLDVAGIFAQNITATGTITGLKIKTRNFSVGETGLVEADSALLRSAIIFSAELNSSRVDDVLKFSCFGGVNPAYAEPDAPEAEEEEGESVESQSTDITPSETIMYTMYTENNALFIAKDIDDETITPQEAEEAEPEPQPPESIQIAKFYTDTNGEGMVDIGHLNLTGSFKKNGNPYLKTASRGISYACAAGSTGGGTYTFGTDISGEAGYTPISIIGWTTGNNNVVLPRLYLGNNNTQLNFTVRNVGNAAVSGTLNVVFLFQAN